MSGGQGPLDVCGCHKKHLLFDSGASVHKSGSELPNLLFATSAHLHLWVAKSQNAKPVIAILFQHKVGPIPLKFIELTNSCT